MNPKVIVLTIVATLIVIACVLLVAFLMVPGISYALVTFGQTAATSAYGPGYGRGMMGGRSGPLQPPGGLTAVSADGKPIAKNDATIKLPENTAAQKVGNLNVTLALSPYPPASFQSGNFDITLTDDKGQPISDAKISLDLTMPGMWMPPSKPDAQNIGDGKYHASAFWTMRDLWRIEVIIQRGNEKQSAFFDVWL
jgi:hypothetical protein